jgi:hypothetical protein
MECNALAVNSIRIREGLAMRSNAFLAIFHLGVMTFLGGAAAHAQTITGSPSLALKNGESVEVGNVYYTINCRSMLKGTPQVEVLEGPPGVTATIKESMVLPRWGNCANRVPGRYARDQCEGRRRPELHSPHDPLHLQDQGRRSQGQSGLQPFASSMNATRHARGRGGLPPYIRA